MTLLLAADLPEAERRVWLQALAAALPGEALIDARDAGRDAAFNPEVDVAFVAKPPPGSLLGLPKLRLIQSLWAGVDGLLADASVPAGVRIARLVDPAMSTAMAETALWAVLGVHRDFFRYERQQRAATWQPLPQRRADEVCVTVLGFGQMGRATVRRLVDAGYRVAAWSARPGHVEGADCRSGDTALHALLATAQIVVNLLPLTPATRGLFDAALLARLPQGAALVNLARGDHVVDADLLAALDSGQLAHAVLDVFAVEPLPASHVYWRHPRVTVLPHVAAQTNPRSAAVIAARNVLALREGRPLENLVDRARGY